MSTESRAASRLRKGETLIRWFYQGVKSKRTGRVIHPKLTQVGHAFYITPANWESFVAELNGEDR